MGRWALTKTSLGGHCIEAGGMLVLGLSGANTDPALGSGPGGHSFTVSNEAHTGFGLGRHRCPTPAQHLGELIATVAVERLWQRAPPDGPGRPRRTTGLGPSPLVRSLNALHVVFHPTAASEHTTFAPDDGDLLGQPSSPSSPVPFPPLRVTSPSPTPSVHEGCAA